MAWRVLVIDDDEQVRKVLEHHLTKEGYDVIATDDGEKAIEKAKEGSFMMELAAMICDIRMPKINGVDTIAYFRQQFPSTPVIVLTGFPDVLLAVGLMKKGVANYLVKPVSKDQLLVAVREAIQKRSWGSWGSESAVAVFP